MRHGGRFHDRSVQRWRIQHDNCAHIYLCCYRKRVVTQKLPELGISRQVWLDCTLMPSVREARRPRQQSTEATPVWYSLETWRSCTSEVAAKRQPRWRLPVPTVSSDRAAHRTLFPGTSSRVRCREAHNPIRKLFVRIWNFMQLCFCVYLVECNTLKPVGTGGTDGTDGAWSPFGRLDFEVPATVVKTGGGKGWMKWPFPNYAGGQCDYVVPPGKHCQHRCPGCGAPTYGADKACPCDCDGSCDASIDPGWYAGIPAGNADPKAFPVCNCWPPDCYNITSTVSATPIPLIHLLVSHLLYSMYPLWHRIRFPTLQQATTTQTNTNQNFQSRMS